jgi:hypothetical protein
MFCCHASQYSVKMYRDKKQIRRIGKNTNKQKGGKERKQAEGFPILFYELGQVHWAPSAAVGVRVPLQDTSS